MSMVCSELDKNASLITYVPQVVWGAVVEWVATKVAEGALERVPK